VAPSPLPVVPIAGRHSCRSSAAFHKEGLDEALQLFFTQAIIAAIQVHDFHKVTVGPAGPSARGFRQIERLAGMADDQPKWLLEDRKLVPFKRFESRFQVQLAVPLPGAPVLG
jgi:hypothetical protein